MPSRCLRKSSRFGRKNRARAHSLTWHLRKYTKAERDGLHFHQVDPKNTSQTCSRCGEKSPKKLSLAIRTFSCQFCGTVLDRDHNAALNILYKAAAAFRGERWVTPLYEARNTNEARDAGLQEATQLTLFDAPNKPKSLGLGS